MNDPVVIVSAARTPMGSFQGALAHQSAIELGALVSQAVLQRSGVTAEQIDELIFGCVLSAGIGQAPARQVALKANLPVTTPATTVSKVCGSGMKSVSLAHDQILAGSCSITIAGGMENMSQAPYLMPNARSGLRIGHGEIKDHLFIDGLEDAYTSSSMGSFAQQTADQAGLTRQEMDDYAIESLRRAQDATTTGYFKAEIEPVTIRSGKQDIQVDNDEQPQKANVEKIPHLKPAFSKEGTITAANASSISDGAAALLLMKQSHAKQLALMPIARIVAHASYARHPSEFAVAPIGAMNKLLKLANWKIEDVDLFEINEAFAVVPLLAMQALGLNHNKVNVHGGACALGHPLGASGARIIVTLIYALQRLQKKRGVASICIGGGEALALAIEIA